MNTSPTHLTVAEAAKRLGIHKRTLQAKIRSGVIEADRVAKNFFLVPIEILRTYRPGVLGRPKGS